MQLFFDGRDKITCVNPIIDQHGYFKNEFGQHVEMIVGFFDRHRQRL
jgi:hypothetical protein